MPENLILKSNLAPGDHILLTAAVRDLHTAHPGKYLTDVRTPHPALWENNPHITPLTEGREIEMHYPLINRSNQGQYHFIHGYRKHLESVLGVSIEPGDFRGDIHLSSAELGWMSQVEEIRGIGTRFWIIVSGGKSDFTAKHWEPSRWQAVVDAFPELLFVQVGEGKDIHPPLRGVLDLRGKTDLRQLIRLMYHCDGVLCPVTSLMHLSAALPLKSGGIRPCVVVAGGREPSQWEAYPGHKYLDTIGQLPCCATGGCWKSRTMPLGDGDEKDKSLCERPVLMERSEEAKKRPIKKGTIFTDVTGEYEILEDTTAHGCPYVRNTATGNKFTKTLHLHLDEPPVYIPACLDRITAAHVIEAVHGYILPAPPVVVREPVAEPAKPCGGCGPTPAAKVDATPAQWGPGKWREFHGRTTPLGETAPGLSRKAEYLWVRQWIAKLPCEECRTKATEVMDDLPMPYAMAMEEYRNWQIAFHNAINRHLGKPELTMEAGRAAIEANRPAPANKLHVRVAICVKCEFYQQATRDERPRCKRDGALLKAKMSTGDCDKWPGYVPPPGPFTLVQLSPAFRDAGDVHETDSVLVGGPLTDEEQRRLGWSKRSRVLHVKFPHGLGDHAHFAAMVVLAREAGYSVSVETGRDKHPILRAAGAEFGGGAKYQTVGWHDPYWSRDLEARTPICDYNKSATNLSCPPMPELGGSRSEQWNRLCRVRLSAESIPLVEKTRVDALIADMPRPITLLHTCGNTWQEVKKLAPSVTNDLCDRLLDKTSGSVVLLDWDNRTTKTHAWRVRHSQQDWGGLSLGELMYLATRADLMIGVDSGPLHVAAIMGCPTVAVWPSRSALFSQYLIPRDNQISVVSTALHERCQAARDTFNVAEYQGDISGANIGDIALSMLSPDRYLPPEKRGVDAMLQHWLRDWQRTATSPLTRRGDRDIGFDYVFRELRGRINPVAIETGCARKMDDWGPWGGAGFSTYMLGVYFRAVNGRLISMDNSKENCELAKSATEALGVVDVWCVDSVAGLSAWEGPLDLLLLDSWDTSIAGFAEHALREVMAIESRLCHKTVLLFDDTVYSGGRWNGKGELAVPYLLGRRWSVAYSGLQTILRLTV